MAPKFLTHAAAVTPSDSNNIPECVLYVGGTGDVAVVTAEGETVTFVGVPAGGYIWVWCTKVNSTNTDATSIVALW